MIFCLSLIMGLSTMMAQDAPKCPQQGDESCQKLTVEQKAQLITDRMAKAYDLTADQKAKLLELNTKALTARGHKAAPCPKDGDKKCDKPCPKDGDKKCDKAKPCPEGGDKKCDKAAPCPEGGDKECAAGPGGYFKALSEIMTPEQFAAYRTDKMIERSLMPQRPQMGGQFGHHGMKAPGFKGGKGMHHHGNQQCAKGGEQKDCAKAAGKECNHDMKGCKDGGKKCSPCKCGGKCAKKSCKKCQACKK